MKWVFEKYVCYILLGAATTQTGRLAEHTHRVCLFLNENRRFAALSHNWARNVLSISKCCKSARLWPFSAAYAAKSAFLTTTSARYMLRLPYSSQSAIYCLFVLIISRDLSYIFSCGPHVFFLSKI